MLKNKYQKEKLYKKICIIQQNRYINNVIELNMFIIIYFDLDLMVILSTQHQIKDATPKKLK